MTTSKSVIGGTIGAIIAIALIVAGVYAFSGGNFFGLTSSSGTGTLQISMTDPPNAPTNVTDVYVNYTSIQVHFANAASQTGWSSVTAKGTIDLMKLVGTSQVIGASPVQSGTYDIIRFNITSAIVTVKSSSGTSQNFSASVPNGMVQVTILEGGVKVVGGQSSAVLVDMTPRVTYQNGSYMLVPAATASPSTFVPGSQLTAAGASSTASGHAP